MTIALDRTPRRSSITPLDRAAQGLGLFSIALGVTEIVFPGALGRALGLEGRKGLLRAYGVREIAAGIGALQPNPAPAIWSRVAGDIMDLATLAQGRSADDQSKRNKATMSMVAVGAITVLDVIVGAACSAQMARPKQTRQYSDRSGFPNGVEAARGAAADYGAKLRARGESTYAPRREQPSI
jgi:hypothetical protein